MTAPAEGVVLEAWSSRKQLEALVAEAEFRKCQRDGRYFVNTYWMIPSMEEGATDGYVPFEFYEYQDEMWDEIHEHAKISEGKVRQIGASTMFMSVLGHTAMFGGDGKYEGYIVSKSQDDAESNLRMILDAYRLLPGWLKRKLPVKDNDSGDTLILRTKAGAQRRIESMVGNVRRGAGRTPNQLVVDEFALYEKPDAAYRSFEPSTLAAVRAWRPGKPCVFAIVSTFRGQENKHARIFVAAKKGENDFHPIFVGARQNRFLVPQGKTWDQMSDAEFEVEWNKKRNEYSDNPSEFFQDYPRTWEEALKESGDRRFQTMPLEDSVMRPVAAGEILQAGPQSEHGYRPRMVQWSEEKEDNEDYEFAFNQSPVKFMVNPLKLDRTRKYVIGADPSTGSGKDYSVAYVGCWNRDDTMEIVAYYADNNVAGAEFARVLNGLGRFFYGEGQGKQAYMAVERQTNEAGSVITMLSQLQYRNFFHYLPLDRESQSRRVKPEIGWPQDRYTKPEAVGKLAECFKEVVDDFGITVVKSTLTNVPEALYDEMGTYVKVVKTGVNGRVTVETRAEGNAHDDHVMACSIMVAVLDRMGKDKRLGTDVHDDVKEESYKVVSTVAVGGGMMMVSPQALIRQSVAASGNSGNVRGGRW